MADDLGDRMKREYEAPETERRFLPMLPIYARIDGRGFSKFTRNMVRPFDERMTKTMVATVCHLVAETHAVIGYTQSDEISLVWYHPDYDSGMMFDRKVQKLVSVLAGLATAAFIQSMRLNFVDWMTYLEKMPHFDARVIQLPNLVEAANMFLWREKDATKNAVSMAAHSMFSHKSLQGMGSADMQERMFQEAGVNFNDYPDFFKRGNFVRRITTERTLDEQELAKIPEANRPASGTTFTRSRVEPLKVPSFGKVINRVGFIFENEEPRLALECENIAESDNTFTR